MDSLAISLGWATEESYASIRLRMGATARGAVYELCDEAWRTLSAQEIREIVEEKYKFKEIQMNELEFYKAIGHWPHKAIL